MGSGKHMRVRRGMLRAYAYRGWTDRAAVCDVFLIRVVIEGEWVVILQPDPPAVPAVAPIVDRCLARLLVKAGGATRVRPRGRVCSDSDGCDHGQGDVGR